jgi:hypothetical protein
MRKILLTIAVLMMLPMSLFAQGEITECPGCLLGIFENPELTQNFGIWDLELTGPSKSLWVGIMYDPAVPLNGLTGVELSISGIPESPFGGAQFSGIPEPTIVIGSAIETPADTTGEGGVNMVWNQCLPENRAVIKIDMLSLSPVGDDIVLRVMRKFPPGSDEFPQELFTQCNAPQFTKTIVTGGCYVINPTVGEGGMVDGCVLEVFVDAVEENTWSHVKALYRD